jgi:hypothetical protein
MVLRVLMTKLIADFTERCPIIILSLLIERCDDISNLYNREMISMHSLVIREGFIHVMHRILLSGETRVFSRSRRPVSLSDSNFNRNPQTIMTPKYTALRTILSILQRPQIEYLASVVFCHTNNEFQNSRVLGAPNGFLSSFFQFFGSKWQGH